MGPTADELRQEIDAKRSDASEKLEQIEEKVTGAATMAKEQVMNTFDWRHQVDQRPLAALGVAFMGGMLLGNVMGGKDDGDRRPSSSSRSGEFGIRRFDNESTGVLGGMGVAAALRSAAKQSGLDEMFNNATNSFMSTMTQRVRQMAEQTFPGMAEKMDGGQSSGDQRQGDKVQSEWPSFQGRQGATYSTSGVAAESTGPTM